MTDARYTLADFFCPAHDLMWLGDGSCPNPDCKDMRPDDFEWRRHTEPEE